MKKDMKNHNGFKKVDMNSQEREKRDNPLVSVFRVGDKQSALKVKGQTAPKGKNEAADGHLGRGSEPKHKETPHFPLRRPNNDVE